MSVVFVSAEQQAAFKQAPWTLISKSILEKGSYLKEALIPKLIEKATIKKIALLLWLLAKCLLT